uniref:MULE domain-containing protein n=1 Tax=Panagrellus redivivus TaxID=6233 RepID=A0A7E4UN79_PANRE
MLTNIRNRFNNGWNDQYVLIYDYVREVDIVRIRQILAPHGYEYYCLAKCQPYFVLDPTDIKEVSTECISDFKNNTNPEIYYCTIEFTAYQFLRKGIDENSHLQSFATENITTCPWTPILDDDFFDGKTVAQSLAEAPVKPVLYTIDTGGGLIAFFRIYRKVIPSRTLSEFGSQTCQFIDLNAILEESCCCMGFSVIMEQLYATILELRIADQETTATTLAWLVIYMMQHSNDQARAQVELSKLISSGNFMTLKSQP